MITESSKDYVTGNVLMLWDGEVPTYEEVNQYCFDNYGFRPNFNYEVDAPNDFMGYINPGTVVAFNTPVRK